MRLAILLIIFLAMAIVSAGVAADDRPFTETIFVDHENLRYVEDEDVIRYQVEEIKKNLDQAAKYGIDTYLLFAKETMEAMLNYDFNIPQIGNIGQQAFPADSKHRETGEYLRSALAEVLDYAEDKNIRVFFHSNQFIFPKQVLEIVKPATWGTAVCPGREATWRVYRGKLDEFFRLFPEIAGIQITGDETQVSVLSCECDDCRDMSFVERVNKLTNETARIAKEHGKEVQMRTWQRMGELGDPANIDTGIPENVYFSIKNTDGDFKLSHNMDREFLTAAKPEYLIVEFDAWREHEGHNFFPCYMGDIWSLRIKFLHASKIKRIAVRLMWNSNKNPIFQRPWGNFVNLYTFLELTKNPDFDPDDILRRFVAEHYPPSAQQAAFDLYKFSPRFQETIYYVKGNYNADHSRVQDEDTEDDLEDAQDEGFMTKAEDFDIRRKHINEVCDQALELVDRLGGELPAQWIEDMRDGIKVERYVALSTTDKMEFIFLQQNMSSGDNMEAALSDLKSSMEARAREWETWDSDSYDSMNGDEMFEVF